MRLDTSRLTWQELDGEAVVLDLASSTYFTVNRTGTFLLGLLRDEQGEQDLVSALEREFGQRGNPQVTEDVHAFLEVLRRRRMLID